MHATTSRIKRTCAALGILLVLAAGIIGCGEDSPDGSPAPPPLDTPTAPPTPRGTAAPTEEPDTGPPSEEPSPTAPGAEDPFRQADQRMSTMVESRATWRAPDRTPVDQTTEIGLTIGDGAGLRAEVEQALPDVPTQPGVPLKVGTDVSARLIGDGADVSITPDDAIDASTGSDIALLWTWKIRPLHPTEELRLTALLQMTVPGTDHRLTKTVHLDLVVTRTLSFTAHQVFTNWGTWTAIVSSLAAGGGWLWARSRRRRQSPPAQPAHVHVPRQSGPSSRAHRHRRRAAASSSEEPPQRPRSRSGWD